MSTTSDLLRLATEVDLLTKTGHSKRVAVNRQWCDVDEFLRLYSFLDLILCGSAGASILKDVVPDPPKGMKAAWFDICDHHYTQSGKSETIHVFYTTDEEEAKLKAFIKQSADKWVRILNRGSNSLGSNPVK